MLTHIQQNTNVTSDQLKTGFIFFYLFTTIYVLQHIFIFE